MASGGGNIWADRYAARPSGEKRRAVVIGRVWTMALGLVIAVYPHSDEAQ